MQIQDQAEQQRHNQARHRARVPTQIIRVRLESHLDQIAVTHLKVSNHAVQSCRKFKFKYV